MSTPFLERCRKWQEDFFEASELVRTVLGDKADEKWGRRSIYESGKVIRVLAEVRANVREGKPIRNVHAYAEDLFKRWP